MSIYITGLAQMPLLVKRFDIQYLVSIVGADAQPPTPPDIPRSRHHRCIVDDIVEDQPGRIVPKINHINELIEFLHAWDTESSLLIHCIAGVSRSTAAALIARTMKTNDPNRAATALRIAAPYAWPNRRIVSLADSILGFEGKLIHAREEMGPADWQIDPDYKAPQLHGEQAHGHKEGRYAELEI